MWSTMMLSLPSRSGLVSSFSIRCIRRTSSATRFFSSIHLNTSQTVVSDSKGRRLPKVALPCNSPPFPHSCSWFSSDISKDNDPTDAATVTEDTGTSFTIPGSQTGGRKLAIVFTCTVCNTRSAKQFTEQAYRNGVVIVRCPGCSNLHLIADRLGYFTDKGGDWDLETLVAQRGEQLQTVKDNNVWELTLEDLVSPEQLKELREGKEDTSS